MKYNYSAILLIAIFVFAGVNAFAQENEAKVVDEVVAQVNEDVLTLSSIRREIEGQVSLLVEQGKTPEEARALVEKNKGELITNLINEQLILQKGKESGFDSEVQAQINQRFLEIMKQQKIKSLDTLYAEMLKNNVDPEAIRESWRKQILRDLVLQREVDTKIYFGITGKDAKAYYESNKAKFTKPEVINISEIFISFAGRDEAAMREKAKKIVADARAGVDFGKLAAENSDRATAKDDKGKIPPINIKELDKTFAEPLKTLKVGNITEPLELPEGIEILRLDARTAASSESFYDETEVKKEMTFERIPAERKLFLSKLRQDSYIKINDEYRPIVAPILYADDRKAEVKKSDK